MTAAVGAVLAAVEALAAGMWEKRWCPAPGQLVCMVMA